MASLTPPPNNTPLIDPNTQSTNDTWLRWFNLVNTTLTSSGIVAYAPIIAGTVSGGPYQSMSSAGTANQIMISAGASAVPTWTTNLTVGQGGTGLTRTTPYSVICGGLTSTGALQQVSGVGTAGQVLESNGAGTLPTWQSIAGLANPASQTDMANLSSTTVWVNPLDITYLEAGTTDIQAETSHKLFLTAAHMGDIGTQILVDKLAAQSDMETATSTTTIVSPGRVQYHPGVTKAWVRFNGSNGAIISSYGVSSVTRNGVGIYTINFSITLSSANYAVIGTASESSPAGATSVVEVEGNRGTTSCKVECWTGGGAGTDSASVSVMILGDI